MKEPDKWEQVEDKNGKKNWRATQAWKDWRKQVLSKGFEQHNATKPVVTKKKYIGRRIPIDPEDHKEVWKEIAWISGTERRILFCCCQSSNSGIPFAGCGAVGIRNTRGGKVTVVVEPRFE